VQRQPQVSSGGPGTLQAVVPSETYAAYRNFMGHFLHCDDCEFGEARCETAKALWAKYIRQRGSAAQDPVPVAPCRCR
jgi:hypothetical protein